MDKKYTMSKQLKLFLLVVAVLLVGFGGYQFYTWTQREDLNVIVLLKYPASEEAITTVRNAIKKEGAKIESSSLSGGAPAYHIRLPWYTGLYKSKNKDTLMNELRAYTEVDDVVDSPALISF